MKIYAMPLHEDRAKIDEIGRESMNLCAGDKDAAIRQLAVQIIGRDARIARLESQVEHWQQLSGKLEARARVNEDGDIAHVRSERDAAFARADRYGRALKAAVELIP